MQQPAGVRYLLSGPSETGMPTQSAHGWFTACPERRYLASAGDTMVREIMSLTYNPSVPFNLFSHSLGKDFPIALGISPHP